MEEFGTLNRGEKTIDILEDRWWPQATKQEGRRDKRLANNLTQYMSNVLGTQLLEVSY